MRLIAGAVLFSFFVPLACELQSALTAPAHPCEQSQSAPAQAPKSTCCFLAAPEVPAIPGPRQANSTVVIAAPPLAFSPAKATVRPSFWVATHELTHQLSPPRLYVLHAAFLI